MISLHALKARARAEHPDAELSYIPAEKGHGTVYNQPMPRVLHAGVRAQHEDMEDFYWTNGDTSMRRHSISAGIYHSQGREPIASLYLLGTRVPLLRPQWTTAQRQQLALPPVPTDLPTWTDPA